MVVFEVLALQIFAALPAPVASDEENPNVVLRAFGDHEPIARQAAGLVDQGRGGLPAGIVEHGVVQRRQDALERVSVAHDGSRLGAGMNRPGHARTASTVPGRPPSDTRFQPRSSSLIPIPIPPRPPVVTNGF